MTIDEINSIGYNDIHSNKVKFKYDHDGNLIEQTSYFIYDPIYKFITPVISKNANTDIKKIICREYLRDINKAKLNVNSYHKICLLHEDEFISNNINDEKFNNYVKFAVYRDPIDRLNSLCNQQGWRFGNDYILYYLKNIKNNTLIDQHLRRQCEFYDINDVDYVVDIKDLDKFLKYKFGIENTSHANSKLFKETYKFYDFIIDYYKDDFNIPIIAKEKNKWFSLD